jgi:probable DNA repair protein
MSMWMMRRVSAGTEQLRCHEIMELFQRLAEGHAARITVVTPNRRLAQALTAEFDAFQIGKGLSVWEAPDILPFGAFVERLWEDALYSELGDKLPLLLTPQQELLLWQEVIATSREGKDLLFTETAAAHCRDAWGLLHQWRIGAGRGNEDHSAFSEWVKQYEEKTLGDIDAARLPDLVAGLLDKLKKPKPLVAYAFDLMPPQTAEFLQHFEFIEVKPDAAQGSSFRTSFPSAKEELETAAIWARTRLEESCARIGVVVPRLETRRKEVVRVFSRVMRPGHHLPGAEKTPLPFNVSLGEPLSNYPLVDAALLLLEFSNTEIPFEKASRLVRSPFLAGAESEMARRATLDVRLRRKLEATVALPKLIAFAEPCPLLRQALEKVFALAGEAGEKSPSEWARHFSALLEAAGFPGERSLDSEEFQTRAKWHEVLGEFARLERVCKRISSQRAFSILEKLCTDTVFQPESVDAPIQVLGVLESAGLRFDCLWVSGLTDEAWPLAARPNPFIPIALQKKAGIPQASAEGSLEFGRRITAEWASSAEEVVFSSPEKEEDRSLAPSPLILSIEKYSALVPDFPRYRDVLFSHKNLHSFEDSKAPPVATKQVRGGTRVLADQAACPFRAFARWRLAAEELEEPAPGLDARQRGALLHDLMKYLWGSLKDSKALEKDLEPAIASAAAAAVKENGLEGRFAELERERLARLAREWLEIEKTRAPFEVAALEERRTLNVAGLELSGRIDRMDRLEKGGHALIDYKTGQATRQAWLGERPDDPQLPLYAVSAPERIDAVAFARLNPGEMAFRGFSKEKGILPKVELYRDWRGLLDHWRKETKDLGAAFAAGDARVDPKFALKTCRLCDLQTLCRVYENIDSLKDAGDE